MPHWTFCLCPEEETRPRFTGIRVPEDFTICKDIFCDSTIASEELLFLALAEPADVLPVRVEEEGGEADADQEKEGEEL